MKKVKIVIEIDECIGCGYCEAVCPQYFEMKGEKTALKGSKKVGKNFELELEEAGCCEEAANGCPVQCIKIKK